MIDNVFALSLVYTAIFSPFSIFLLRTYFLAIPREIEEAAIVDGANRWQVFYKVCLPLASPGILSVAVISGLNTWNEFLISSTFLQSRDAQTAIVRFYTLRGQYSSDWEEIMAAAILIAAPAVAFFLLMQRQLFWIWQRRCSVTESRTGLPWLARSVLAGCAVASGRTFP